MKSLCAILIIAIFLTLGYITLKTGAGKINSYKDQQTLVLSEIMGE